MRTLKRKMSEVKIDDISQAWLDNPVRLENLDAKVRKEFKNQWKQWLNEWILVVDKNERITYKIRLIQRADGELYPEVQGESLINFHAGILFTTLKDLIETQSKEDKETVDQSVIMPRA